MNSDPNRPEPTAAPASGHPADASALPPGTRFGEFEIVRVLGAGGFGIVYLAQDHSLERFVALKEYMPASLAARGAGPTVAVHPGADAATYANGLRSFINEARLLARFDHASLVKVYRCWEDNGTAYMVMPFLQGTTLRDARRAMAQPPDEAWIRGVLDPMLDALAQLHAQGVCHRDIAPDNIVLPPGGVPILLDFGAARCAIRDGASSMAAILKPSYAPIEQYAEMPGLHQGPWTDIYALGAVMHFLLFGEPPAPATARAQQGQADPVAQIAQRSVPGVSAHFIGVVAWMLGVRPNARPQSVAALRAALDGQIDVPARERDEVTLPGYAAPDPGARPFAAPDTPAGEPVAPVVVPDVRGMPGALAMPDAPAAPVTLLAADTVDTPFTPAVPGTAEAPAQQAAPAPSETPAPSDTPGTPPLRHALPGAAVDPISADVIAEATTAAPPIPAAPPRRRSLAAAVAGLGVAGLVAAAVLWQFVDLISSQRPAGGAFAVDTSMQPDRASTASALGTALAPNAGAVPRQAVAPAALIADVAAPVGDRAIAASAPTPASAVIDPAATTPAVDAARRPRQPPRPAPARAPQRDAKVAANHAPATARASCGDRQFIALAICMDRECERPRYRADHDCVRVLEIKRRRTERGPMVSGVD